MSQSEKAFARRLSVAALCSATIFFAMEAPAQGQSLQTHHVRQAVSGGEAPYLNPLPSAQTLRLHVVLPLRNREGLHKFLQELYDPASPSYRQFLTVAEFTAQFGPSQEDYDALTRYLTSNGFQKVGGSRDGMDLQIEGPVSAVETAFHVSIGVYQHPTEDRTFYAPDREPSVGLPFPLWHISGLDNYATPHPRLGHKGPGGTPSATVGSGPSASFLGSDMRAAYYGGTALTGAGQNLGLFEFEGTDLADLTTYYKNTGQTNNVPVTLLSVDGTSTSCVNSGRNACDDTEQTLDMTQALGMAPGLASLVVYIGSTDTAIISAMTTHSPLPTTIGCSWGWTPADATTLDPYFEKMAAQGQNFFAASGDASTWSTKNEAWPADDANVVSVGGTDLSTTGAAGAWSSETAWTDSGGGISPDKIAIPSWQQQSGVITSSNKGSTTYRNGPDVSANANFSFYVCADQEACTANSYGGTSFAAPMWAGYLALVNQQAAANGHATLGFINPLLYSYGLSSSYSTYFHDIVSGTSGSYSAGTGYDLVTGWGSPNGTGLINALSGVATPAGFTISASPTSASVVQGSSGSSTITTAASGGFNSSIVLSASGQPAGVTVSFNPTSIAGSGNSTMTMTVASNAAAGSYPITVTGTGGGIAHSATVTLTVTAGTPAGFTISASPNSASVVQGSKGTSTITTTASGGFNSAIALTATGQPAGVTVAFSPTSITGSGTSTMTMTVASNATAGSYPLTVTGTGGGITHTATVTLTVTTATSAGFTISASPNSGSLPQNSKGSTTITTTASGGFNSAIALTASGQPSSVTVSFSPSSITGSGNSTMTMTVASNAAAGTYPITVTGTGGGITHTTTVTLTVTGTPSFSLSASPSTLTISPGSKGTSTITTSVAGGFNASIELVAIGLPFGVTASFNPSVIPAPGSGTSTMTLTASSSTAAGTYQFLVYGFGGGLTNTTTVTLRVP